jgi:hypothetical protein
MGNIPPLDDDDDHGSIEEITVKVVEDEQSLLSTIADLLVDVGFINPTPCWRLEEGSVVNSTHVITRASESEWYPKDEDCCIDPSWMIPFIESKETPFEDVR